MRRILKETVVISYDYKIAPDVLHRWMWSAMLNGDAFHYHRKKTLIKKAEEKGLPWVVIRRHAGGKISIVSKSKPINSSKRKWN